MATEPRRIVLTYDDLVQMPTDRNRYEILEGELYVSAAPNIAHQKASAGLHLIVGTHVAERDLGLFLAAPTDVLLSEITVVEPDLVFVSKARLSIVTPAHIRGTPDLVVEILSPGTAQTDRGVKMQVYARHGVPSYWLVDPHDRLAEAYALESGGYRLVASARDDATFSAPPFLELAIPLARLWS